MIGLGIHLVGARYGRAPLVIDFSSAPNAGGVFALPAWMSIGCASAARSAQVAAASVRTGFGANAARARSLDGSTWGLLVEAASSNEADADPSSWTAFNGGEITATSATDPTGGASSCSINTLATTTPFLGKAMTIGAGACCVSAWTKNAGASPGTINSNISDIANSGAIALAGGDASFVRRSTAGTTAGGSKFSVIQPRTGAVAGSVLAYGYQIEPKLYPGSVLGAGVSRAADVVSVTTPSAIASGGFFDLTLTFVPHYATAEQGVDHDLIRFGTNDRLFLRASDHKLVLRIGGADVASNALSWSRNQALTVRAAHLVAGRALEATGATSGNGATADTAAAALSLPATAYLLGSNTGAQEHADLRKLRIA